MNSREANKILDAQARSMQDWVKVATGEQEPRLSAVPDPLWRILRDGIFAVLVVLLALGVVLAVVVLVVAAVSYGWELGQ